MYSESDLSKYLGMLLIENREPGRGQAETHNHNQLVTIVYLSSFRRRTLAEWNLLSMLHAPAQARLKPLAENAILTL